MLCEEFVRRQNIQRYERLLCASTDRKEQLLLIDLLVEELKKQREASDRAMASADAGARVPARSS
jgi:hypothetical protein